MKMYYKKSTRSLKTFLTTHRSEKFVLVKGQVIRESMLWALPVPKVMKAALY